MGFGSDLAAAVEVFERAVCGHFDQFGGWTAVRGTREATVVWSVPGFAPRVVLADAAGGLALWQPSFLPAAGLRVGQTVVLSSFRVRLDADACVDVGGRCLLLPRLTHVVVEA
jgi:hypothetical protein